MRANDLIQNRAGVELPSNARWTIASGQPISVEQRRALRTTSSAFETTTGVLEVSPDPATVRLDLGLVATEDIAGRAPSTIGFEGFLRSADRTGRWSFDGTVTIDGEPSPFELVLNYQGVFARGAAPVAWLAIAAACRPDEGGRRGRRRQLGMTGDVNAQRAVDGDVAPPGFTDRASVMGVRAELAVSSLAENSGLDDLNRRPLVGSID